MSANLSACAASPAAAAAALAVLCFLRPGAIAAAEAQNARAANLGLLIALCGLLPYTMVIPDSLQLAQVGAAPPPMM